MTTADVAAALDETMDASRAPLLAISEEAAGKPAGSEKWSRKEILGHLIDSASNNHHRFVRLQSEELLVMPSYQQNHWVGSQNYNGREWSELVEFWLAYNRHLAHVIRHVDARAAGHIWRAPGKDYRLEFLIEDYLSHLRHHLAQILGASAAA
ncbi:MAG TPA: DinB family protein [Bryobacteraceae bacterium]|nr:DinB family protein [Bryobacteraceae bacterium]